MKRTIYVSLGLLAVIGCSGADRNPPASASSTDKEPGLSGTLTLTGSSTVAPLALQIGKRFEEKHPNVRVNVQMGGSSRGIADARRGLADIGMVSRALTDEEADLTAHAIALDGIALIVHRSNPVESLTEKQVVGIFTGSINTWMDVGGADGEITVVSKAAGRSTLEVFLDHFGLEPADVKADLVIGDNEQGVKTVSGLPTAIGYVSIGTAAYDVLQGAEIKLVKLSDVEPSVQNVLNETYPIRRSLNLITKGKPTGLVKQFIEFARSYEVGDVVSELAYVPISR